MSSLAKSDGSSMRGETVVLPICSSNETYFGPYRLLQLVNIGGMGEVYLAEDVRLGREIALKMLPEQYTKSAIRVQRFVREAKSASALNHPNIITIFDIGEANGKHYLVTEYIKGQTLRQLLAKPLGLAMALDVGIQLACALNATHEAGIIHRDIKPENVMVRPDGLVKVLDFGIAKLVEAPWSLSPAEWEQEDTVILSEYTTNLDILLTTADTKGEMTIPGTLLGTVAYMSPEQLRGEIVDARSDIFSLGVLLYELIAGVQPFSGKTQADKIAAILEHTPAPLADYLPEVPAELESIIGKALVKDRDFRHQDIKDFLAELKRLKEGLEFQEHLKQSGHYELYAPEAEAKVPDRRWLRLLARSTAAALVITLSVATGLNWPSHRAAALSDTDTIVLADFINTTGDPIFEGTLRQALASQLEQSPFLRLLPEDRIRQTLSLMDKPNDTRLSRQVACEVCMRSASRATIEGSISGLGSQYELELKAVDCQSLNTLAAIRATANGKEQVLRELGQAAAKLREQLGESLVSVQKYDAPTENVTTRSLEALQAYCQGYHRMNVDADYKSAIPFFEKAAARDPNFAMAYALLATAYSNNGDRIRAAFFSREAFALRQRVSEREGFYIKSTYEKYVTNNLEDCRKIYEQWAEIYPRDDTPVGNLGDIYSIRGEYEMALSSYQQGLRLDPGSGIAYGNLLSVYLKLNRLDEAKAVIHEAQARHLDFLELHRALYLIHFLENNQGGMKDEAALMIENPGWAPTGFYLESETAAYGGQFVRARESAKRALDDLRSAGRNEETGWYLAQAALRETLVGNETLARSQAEEALNLSGHQSVLALYALSMGLAGDRAKAARIADDLSRRFPENTSLQLYFLPMIRGAAAGQGAQGAKVPGALDVSAPYGLGSISYIILYPVYLRGLSCLANRKGAAAAAEFQIILDNPGLVGNELIGALAHLGLGRAYAMTGDAARARTAYQDFFALWKEADPDVPVLKQARAEYAKLG
jgi:eukaryotic-like serine/threonine-protein kinase